MRFHRAALGTLALLIGGIGATDDEKERSLRGKNVGITIGHPGWPREQHDPDDLGIRFSKVYFEGPMPEGMHQMLPLTMQDFPLDMETAGMIRQSSCISVVMREDCEDCMFEYTEELIAKIGGYPAQPVSNSEGEFWERMREVVQVQKLRRSDVDPSFVMPLPNIWKDPKPTMARIANNVHDELPGTWHADLTRELIEQGFDVDLSIIPSHSSAEFLRREVMLAHLITWAVSVVGADNFAVKWFVGRARPEEVAWLIAQGKLTEKDGVPKDIFDDIMRMNLQSQFNFTAYPEGSPTHASWPAMHSAGSAASLWLPVVLHLSDEQICQVKLVDWAVSYARTVAGVHYTDDNLAGLAIGHEIIALALPGHLERKYGSDPNVVREKIDRTRFDWNEFVNSDCYKNNFGPSRNLFH